VQAKISQKHTRGPLKLRIYNKSKEKNQTLQDVGANINMLTFIQYHDNIESLVF